MDLPTKRLPTPEQQHAINNEEQEEQEEEVLRGAGKVQLTTQLAVPVTHSVLSTGARWPLLCNLLLHRSCFGVIGVLMVVLIGRVSVFCSGGGQVINAAQCYVLLA
jgi:hypothetical protein